MLARQIKDLSIALEALSRVQRVDEYVFSAVESLLKDKIEQLEKEHQADLQAPKPTQTQDDKIPF